MSECGGSATLIAQEIRSEIFKRTQLTASAGIAGNKLLAKIASDQNKPNGQTVVLPTKVDEFISVLPVTRIFGVGKVSAKKMHEMGIYTCSDLQKYSKSDPWQKFGKWGERLYDCSRGIDSRPVVVDRKRKSLSVERTFEKDIYNNFVYNNLQTNVFNVTPNLEYHFKLIHFGDYIELSINGQVTLSLIDKTYNHRYVGIYVESAEVELSDSKLCALIEPQTMDIG